MNNDGTGVEGEMVEKAGPKSTAGAPVRSENASGGKTPRVGGTKQTPADHPTRIARGQDGVRKVGRAAGKEAKRSKASSANKRRG